MPEGSHSDFAFGLVQLALDGAQPDEALRVLFGRTPA